MLFLGYVSGIGSGILGAILAIQHGSPFIAVVVLLIGIVYSSCCETVNSTPIK